LVVFVVGVPLILAYAAARLVPGALWFNEVGQGDVFTKLLMHRADLYLRVAASATFVVAANLVVAVGTGPLLRTRHAILGVVAVSLVVGSLFAAAAESHAETYALWKHRQPFGINDPIHGRDIGFFVFSLPFYLFLTQLLLWLLSVTAGLVATLYLARGQLSLRSRRADFVVQVHLACIAAALLLVGAWRLRLAQYLLELDQPSASDTHTFAGAGYVDVNVRSPMLTFLGCSALALAVLCVALPFVAQLLRGRVTRRSIGAVGALLAIGLGLVGGIAPALVQRYIVDPNPLLSEQAYLERAITATRAGLNLDDIQVQPYTPSGSFTAANFPAAQARLARVSAWDTYILEARMQQLVSEPPYYRPGQPALDIVDRNGRAHLTAVSARELDLTRVTDEGGSWSNDRLGYTHGLGLVRFSSTDIAPDRQPHVLDTGLALAEPRIYFGDMPVDGDVDGEADGEADGEPQLLTPAIDPNVAQSHWVLANTRRAEVDIPVGGTSVDPYHYDGTGGIAMSTWARRAVFALALGSKELLLSDDITNDSRLLLHRDVHDRLETLAPFITWDSDAIPLTADGRVTFVVYGYTTSAYYPYGERVELGGSRVNYARASVMATVDAFNGDVRLYAIDQEDPILRAWQEVLPTLFHDQADIPAELRGRLRYPPDLFNAQAQAYERFHTTNSEVFASNSDVWSRPIALSGPIEVAGDIDFDEDDEDDLRLTMPPAYFYGPPPGHIDPALVLATYYSPGERGQNLVAALDGWIDESGEARLAARTLPRDPIILGPAQVSRLVFATPRVRNLLGLRNLEIRDLDRSSIDSVLLGRPRILFLPGGRVQIQNLYEGSRGPGAARLLGVTAFVNGRAGLGPNAESALRQALNEPPTVEVVPPPPTVIVDEPLDISFHVENARHEVVTIITNDGRTRLNRTVSSGLGTVQWQPTTTGTTVVRVQVFGLDGTTATARASFRVLTAPPIVRLLDAPEEAVAGNPLRIRFSVANAVEELVTVSTRAGIVFERRFEIRKGSGVISWTPQRSGTAVLQIRTRGHQNQMAVRTLTLDVAPRESPQAPTVALIRVPQVFMVERSARFTFEASNCRSATALIVGPDGIRQTWRFHCPAQPATVIWLPTVPGVYTFTATAQGEGTSSEASIVLPVGERP
jgi:uncharacterized membrane protein (UPF0182 family)